MFKGEETVGRYAIKNFFLDKEVSPDHLGNVQESSGGKKLTYAREDILTG